LYRKTSIQSAAVVKSCVNQLLESAAPYATPYRHYLLAADSHEFTGPRFLPCHLYRRCLLYRQCPLEQVVVVALPPQLIMSLLS
jgi:hypothetical protein